MVSSKWAEAESRVAKIRLLEERVRTRDEESEVLTCCTRLLMN